MNALPHGTEVALAHDWLTGMRGGEKVLEEVLHLFPAAPIYTLFHFPGSVSRAIESHPIHTSFLQRAPGLRRHYRSYLPLFPLAVEDFDLGAAELVISTSHCVAKGVVPGPRALHVSYTHSPMRYAWDQEHAYFPRRRGPVARLRGAVLSWLRAWDVTASARVDHFLANSRFVAARIERYYRRAADVLHPPADTDYFTPGENGGSGGGGAAGGGYCLMVAALAPYKRVEVAMAACERAGLELRVVGGGPEQARLAAAAGPRTRLVGRVGDEELRRLYRGAVCLVQPGVEDFGIAPVEALACGTPVVALGAGGVLDVVEDGVHGVLYELAGNGTGSAAADHPAILAAAIDKARGIGFNVLNLRNRAEEFSRSRFRERLSGFLKTYRARREPTERPNRRGTPVP
jgi:glycosyltransferase involved in cell wall biosynthesis